MEVTQAHKTLGCGGGAEGRGGLTCLPPSDLGWRLGLSLPEIHAELSPRWPGQPPDSGHSWPGGAESRKCRYHGPGLDPRLWGGGRGSGQPWSRPSSCLCPLPQPLCMAFPHPHPPTPTGGEEDTAQSLAQPASAPAPAPAGTSSPAPVEEGAADPWALPQLKDTGQSWKGRSGGTRELAMWGSAPRV